MVYSFTRCPVCHKVIKSETNPTHKIDMPFEKCPECGSIYLNTYKEEWITKSPTKRFFFFLRGGVLSGAIVVPILLITIISLAGDIDISNLAILLPLLSIAWLITGYFIRKRLLNDDIQNSIIRTKNIEYLNRLKNAGYSVYPIDETEMSNNGASFINNTNPINKTNRPSNNGNFAQNNNAQYTTANNIQFCRKCGNKIIENSKFCNACGSKIDWN